MKKETISFSAFWDAYALKRDRLAALRAWNRLSDKDRHAAFSGIASYREDCQNRGIAMMYAQGYLSHRRWEDETTPAVPAAKTEHLDADKDNKPSAPDVW